MEATLMICCCQGSVLLTSCPLVFQCQLTSHNCCHQLVLSNSEWEVTKYVSKQQYKADSRGVSAQLPPCCIDQALSEVIVTEDVGSTRYCWLLNRMLLLPAAAAQILELSQTAAVCAGHLLQPT